METHFKLEEFVLGHALQPNVTKRSGDFVVLKGESVNQKDFKENLSGQPIFDEYINIPSILNDIYSNITDELTKDTPPSPIQENIIENIVYMVKFLNLSSSHPSKSLAAVGGQAKKTVYIQIHSDAQNWEIIFSMNDQKIVEYFDIFTEIANSQNSKTILLRDGWKQILEDAEHTETPRRPERSFLTRPSDDGVVADDIAADRVADEHAVITEGTDTPVWLRTFIYDNVGYHFWQSWAQWVFMFQDHKTVNEAYKEFFMEKFMSVVAKELFDIPGAVVHVQRHKNRQAINNIGTVKTFHTGGHIEATHSDGKILILYKNLPHGESPEDYDKLIRDTGTHWDTWFVYIGDEYPEKCQQVPSLQAITDEFYKDTAPGHSSSRRAAAGSKNGDDGTEKLFVDSDDEETDDREERAKDNEAIKKLFRQYREEHKLHKKAGKSRTEEEREESQSDVHGDV